MAFLERTCDFPSLLSSAVGRSEISPKIRPLRLVAGFGGSLIVRWSH
jgi:hypothetical protein